MNGFSGGKHTVDMAPRGDERTSFRSIAKMIIDIGNNSRCRESAALAVGNIIGVCG